MTKITYLKRFTSATVVTQFVNMITAVLLRNLLGPINMGVWSLMQVFMNYAKFSSLGTHESLSREVPYLLGRNELDKAQRVQNSVLNYSLLSSLFMTFGVFIYLLIRKNSIDASVYVFMFATVLLIPAQRFGNVLIVVLRGRGEFGVATRQMIFSAIFNGFCVCIGAYYFGMQGFIAGTFLSLMFTPIYILLSKKIVWNIQVDWGVVISSIKYGSPIMIAGLLDAVFINLDRMVIAKHLGFYELGLYSLSVMTAGYISIIPNAFSVVMIPSLHAVFGKNPTSATCIDYARKWLRLHLIVIPPMVMILWMFLSEAVKLLLPEYVGGVRAAQYFVFGAYFFALSMSYINIIVVQRKQVYLIAVSVATIVLAMLFNFIAIKQHMGIEGIALATSLANMFKFLMVFCISQKMTMTYREALIQFGFIIAESLLLFACCLISRDHNWYSHPAFYLTLMAQIVFLYCASVYLSKPSTQNTVIKSEGV
ncbi:MAG: oligosaccharide flippase family protein [Candidatus Omnitrophica bacterium]|nr:oligosaccharide flippase family protein [Candidatus Omnitrophota bacterium]